MINLIMGIIKGICCVSSAVVQTKTAVNSSICCLPVKCAIEIKDCYDHYTSDVTPESDVQMAGAPTIETMA
jgi:hypothetical protein